MKKLMIAAAAAALVGGAFAAGDCTPDAPGEVVTPALVYQFKATVKTTKGLAVKSVTNDKGSTCTPGAGRVETPFIVRVPDTTKFQGWIYECDYVCDTIGTGNVVVWDSKRKAQLEGAAFDTEEEVLNVMGKKQANAEWAWKFAGAATYADGVQQAYALTGAGLGKYSAKKGFYTSFSGNFAGTADASYNLVKNAECDPSQVWKCTDLTAEGLVDAKTVAYGSWTAKYSASASKKFKKNGYLNVPSYVTYSVEP